MAADGVVDQQTQQQSNDYSQDLFSPLQFCEVIQGAQQQTGSPISGRGIPSSALPVISPSSSLVTSITVQQQQQHSQQMVAQHQQLALHSSHKSLQAFPPPAPSSLSLPPGATHIPAPVSTPSISPLHHQHAHHIHHQIQLQQLHHHQQQLQHHGQQLQPSHQIHHSHHHHTPHHHPHHHPAHHIHPQHLYHHHQVQHQQQQHLQLQQHHLQQQQQQQQHQQLTNNSPMVNVSSPQQLGSQVVEKSSVRASQGRSSVKHKSSRNSSNKNYTKAQNAQQNKSQLQQSSSKRPVSSNVTVQHLQKSNSKMEQQKQPFLPATSKPAIQESKINGKEFQGYSKNNTPSNSSSNSSKQVSASSGNNSSNHATNTNSGDKIIKKTTGTPVAATSSTLVSSINASTDTTCISNSSAKQFLSPTKEEVKLTDLSISCSVPNSTSSTELSAGCASDTYFVPRKQVEGGSLSPGSIKLQSVPSNNLDDSFKPSNDLSPKIQTYIVQSSDNNSPECKSEIEMVESVSTDSKANTLVPLIQLNQSFAQTSSVNPTTLSGEIMHISPLHTIACSGSEGQIVLTQSLPSSLVDQTRMQDLSTNATLTLISPMLTNSIPGSMAVLNTIKPSGVVNSTGSSHQTVLAKFPIFVTAVPKTTIEPSTIVKNQRPNSVPTSAVSLTEDDNKVSGLTGESPSIINWPSGQSRMTQESLQNVKIVSYFSESPSSVKESPKMRSVCIGTDTLPSEDQNTSGPVVSVSTNTSPPSSPGVDESLLSNCEQNDAESSKVLSPVASQSLVFCSKQNEMISLMAKTVNSSAPKTNITQQTVNSVIAQPSAKTCNDLLKTPISNKKEAVETTSIVSLNDNRSTQPTTTDNISPQYQTVVYISPSTEINETTSIDSNNEEMTSTNKNYNRAISVKREQLAEKEEEVTVIAIASSNTLMPSPLQSTTSQPPQVPVKKTWRRPWKKKKEREKKKKPPKKVRRSKPRRRVVYHRTQVLHVDKRNGPPIDTTKTIVSRPSEDNIDSLKQKRQRIKLNRNSGREYINRLGKVSVLNLRN